MSYPTKAYIITTFGKCSDAVQIADDVYRDGGAPRKRKRLTHLTTEEKNLRRKLKNRVAAQTARDRKKALMTELEETIAKLQEENKRLCKENAELRHSQALAQEENDRLKNSSVSPASVSGAIQSATASCKVEATDVAFSCKTEPDFFRSAAPAVSLPKEQIQALSRVMMHPAACTLTLSLMLSLISWKNGAQNMESSSRRHKQLKPARLSTANAKSVVVKTCSQQQEWWGPHQQMWTPSMT